MYNKFALCFLNKIS